VLATVGMSFFPMRGSLAGFSLDFDLDDDAGALTSAVLKAASFASTTSSLRSSWICLAVDVADELCWRFGMAMTADASAE
jgi:hypothetical protein